MASKRKRTYKRKKPIPIVISNPSPRRYRRRNPALLNLSELETAMYQTLGFVGYDYLSDLLGLNRYVGSGDSYSHNWARNIISLVGGILLKEKKGFLGKIGEGIMLRGMVGVANSFIEDKEITNTIAKALANSQKENVKALVGPSALGGLGNGSGLGDYLQLDDGSIINTETGEVISQPATQIYTPVSGFNGTNYFELN